MQKSFSAGILCALLAAIAVPALADGEATSPVEYKNGNCGFSIAKLREIGAAHLTRTGDVLQVDVVLTKAPKNVDYQVQLYDGDTCSPIESLGNMATDRRGRGDFSDSTNVAGHSSFFVTIYGGNNSYNGYSDALIVELP